MAAVALRLFVALELPAEVRGALARWQATLHDDTRLGLRAVAPEALHATLCFLGSRPLSQVEDVARACDRVRRLPVRQLSLGEALWLPPRGPRVLAISLVDRIGELVILQTELRGALVAAGLIVPERRPFLAHVSVARLRRAAVAGTPRPAATHLPEPPPQRPFDARRVILYRSHLGRGPARYEALHQVELARR